MEKHIRGVDVKSGESVDRALKRLKTKLDTEGILEEMRRRRSHESTIDRAIRKARTAPKRNKVRWRFQSESQVATAEAAKAARKAE
jgi:small subunit ribosomal protein S21